MLVDTLNSIQEAVRSFLTPLMGEEPPLKIGRPVEADVNDIQAEATPLLGVHSPSAGYAIIVDPEWLPLIARLKTGDEIQAGDQGYESVVTDLATQVQHVIREWFVSDGAAAPTEAGFQIKPPDAPLPDACFTSNDLRIPVSLEWEGKLLNGFIVMAAPEEETPETSVPETEDISPARARQSGDVHISAAAFPELGSERDGDQMGGDLGLLAEVELEVSVELGNRRMPLAEILRLTTGSVIELDKMVGEPLLIYANNRLIAEGEAVVIDDQFGVRVTGLAARVTSRAIK